MAKKKQRLQFRYYQMAPDDQVLALLGDSWRRSYGADVDELHFHNYMEVGICYEGCGESVLRERRERFRKGSMVIVPPNYPHTNNSDGGGVAYWEWIYLDIESVLQDMKEISFSKLDADYILNVLYEEALFFQQEEYPRLSEIIRDIRRESAKKAYMYREKLKGLLQMFVVELLRIRNISDEMPRKSPRSFQIAPALDYLREHYNEDIRIRDLARVCNVSESHFRRIFQECMNMTPGDHVNVIRIREATRLLLKSHATMEEVAYRVGYGNVSTFNRNFKKMLGVTPYQWKRSPDNYAGQMLNFKISALKGW